MKQVQVEELARPVTSMKRLKNVRQFLGQVEEGAKLEGSTLRMPAPLPWEGKAGALKTAKRVKRLLAGGKTARFKPGDKVTVKPLMWQGEAYMPGIPEGWMERYLHHFGKEKPTAAQMKKATKGIPRLLREDFGADVAKE